MVVSARLLLCLALLLCVCFCQAVSPLLDSFAEGFVFQKKEAPNSRISLYNRLDSTIFLFINCLCAANEISLLIY